MSAADDLVLSIREFAGLIKDVSHLAEGNESTEQNSLISLGDEIIYGIAAAYKNGVAITDPTDYAWKTYRPNVSVVAAPAANDIYLFRVKTGLSDDAIQEQVDRAKDIALSALRQFYETTESIDTKPSFLEIVRDLTAGRLLQMRSRGVALESAHFRSGRDLELGAMARIQRIKQGRDEILDSTGAKVARKSGSTMGGFKHSQGAIDERRDWWKRLRMYDGTILKPVLSQEGASSTEA